MMLVAERVQHILRLVNERGSMRVTELSQICRVTEETIRRDLDRLESEGRLLRSYGGAIRLQPQTSETSYELRETVHVPEKQRISAQAAKYVEPHDRIGHIHCANRGRPRHVVEPYVRVVIRRR